MYFMLKLVGEIFYYTSGEAKTRVNKETVIYIPRTIRRTREFFSVISQLNIFNNKKGRSQILKNKFSQIRQPFLCTEQGNVQKETSETKTSYLHKISLGLFSMVYNHQIYCSDRISAKLISILYIMYKIAINIRCNNFI